MPYSHYYICRVCSVRVDCHPFGPKFDMVKAVLVDAKKGIYEFACLKCANSSETPR